MNVFDISNVAVFFFDLQLAKQKHDKAIEYICRSGNWTRHLIIEPTGIGDFIARENGVPRSSETLTIEDNHILHTIYRSRPLYLRLMKIASYKNNEVFWVLSHEMNLELI